MSILLCNSYDDAIIAYVAKQWKDNNLGIDLGRTMIQKLCYFLKAGGVPLDFKFDMYHYGPYSQELYYRMDELLVDGIIADISQQKSKSVYIPGEQIEELLGNHDISEHINDIDNIINLFDQFKPNEMELLATIHYIQTTSAKYYGQVPEKDYVVEKVIDIKKERFSKDLVSRVYDVLEIEGLFGWNAN